MAAQPCFSLIVEHNFLSLDKSEVCDCSFLYVLTVRFAFMNKSPLMLLPPPQTLMKQKEASRLLLCFL